MGLDIYFFDGKREKVGYFRKVNFLLTYFDVDIDEDTEDVEISREQLATFVKDLEDELNNRVKPHTLAELEQGLVGHDYSFSEDIVEPVNPRLRCTYVFFGGSTEYGYWYWNDMVKVYYWAKETLETFDFDNSKLIMWPWW